VPAVSVTFDIHISFFRHLGWMNGTIFYDAVSVETVIYVVAFGTFERLQEEVIM
jgi:hypothetical protein